jgi:hypothetical protein
MGHNFGPRQLTWDDPPFEIVPAPCEVLTARGFTDKSLIRAADPAREQDRGTADLEHPPSYRIDRRHDGNDTMADFTPTRGAPIAGIDSSPETGT